MSQTESQRLRVYLATAIALIVLYLTYRIFIPFFVPLFWGTILGVIFHPLYRRLNTWAGQRSMLTALVLTAAIFILVLIPAIALGFELVARAIDIFRGLQETLGTGGIFFGSESLVGRYVWPLVERLGLTRQEVGQAVAFVVQQVGGFAVELGSTVVGNTVQLVFDIFFTLVILYYVFTDGEQFLDALKQLLPLSRQQIDRLMGRLHHVVMAGILSSFVVAITQAVAAGLLLWLLGFAQPLLLAMAVGLASLVPVLGAPAVYIPAGLYLLVTGQYLQLLVLAVLATIIVMLIEHLLRPIIVHERVRIHNFYLFFGILGGLYLTGVTGILFGPIVVALWLEVIGLYRERRDGQPRPEEGG